MADTHAFLEALKQRAPWVDELLLAPELLHRVQPPHLQRLVAAYLERGGKRLRPAVLLLCCGAVGGDEKHALPAAAALELFHTWTLMHDDIIDHDALRRGGPSGHALGAQLAAADIGLTGPAAEHYGVSLAMLAGDVQHGLCVNLFLNCTNPNPALVMQLAADLELNVLCDLVEGETIDIQLADRPIEAVDLDETIRMMYLKTGALYEFAGKAGAMLGLNTTDEKHPHVDALRRFCASCGIAFQLQDDILGVVGTQEKLGKPVGSDIIEGKRTPVLLEAYARADQAQRTELLRVVGNPEATDQQVRRTIATIVELGAVQAVQAMARERIEEAHTALAAVPSSRYTRWLAGWAHYMIERDF